MNWRRLLLTTALLALASPITSPTFAQTPAALPQLDVSTTPGTQGLNSLAVDGLGNVTLLWAQLASAGSLPRARRFSPNDVPLGPDMVLSNQSSNPEEVVANRRGDYIMVWNELIPTTGAVRAGVLRRVSPSLRQLNLRFPHAADDVDVDRLGNFILVWTAETPAGRRVVGQRFNSDGTTRGPEFMASTTLSPGGENLGGVAMNQQTGEFVIVWISRNADNSVRGIFGQRFGFLTGRQGSEFQVNTTDIGAVSVISRVAADVGRAEDGSFVVAWSFLPESGGGTDIFAQRFDNAGARLGNEIVIAADAPITDGFVHLAVAPQGHFVTAWDDGSPPLFVRLYRKNGTPAGPARELVNGTTPFPGAPRLDFGYNNTFVLGWDDFIGIHDPDDDNWEVNYQRFAASPGTEICLFRNGRFRCDTNGGGALETDHVFSVRGGTPLLGDVDADGRDDYCLFRGTRFDCDSGHDYRAAETVITFGQPGDTPLLGDVDGDGRAEACVFRTNTFLCDTGHDGGAAETTFAFGQAGDRALMGDIDGDGRDEACVFRTDGFLCDTLHNGGAAETVIGSGTLGGNVPLLGDINDDGRDDPCFFGVSSGVGVFRCDVGDVTVEVRVDGTGRPLIGNVDGL
jgi:hypothetical protein